MATTCSAGWRTRCASRTGAGTADGVPLDGGAHVLDADPRHWALLTHWNQFTHHSSDALRAVAHALGADEPTPAQLVAALLYPLLEDQLDTHDARVRSCLAKGTPLPAIVDPTPPPRFRCASCGKARQTARDARFHCRGIYKRR